jgi:hypothetical protein
MDDAIVTYTLVYVVFRCFNTGQPASQQPVLTLNKEPSNISK